MCWVLVLQSCKNSSEDQHENACAAYKCISSAVQTWGLSLLMQSALWGLLQMGAIMPAQYFNVSDFLSARVHFCQGNPHIQMWIDCENERWKRGHAILLFVREANQNTKEVSCYQGYVQSWPQNWWCSLDPRLGLKENACFAFHVLRGTWNWFPWVKACTSLHIEHCHLNNREWLLDF